MIFFVSLLILGFSVINAADIRDTKDSTTLAEPDWKEFSDNFNNLANAATPDGLKMAKILRNSVASFLKIGRSIGGIFAAALSLDPDSSEQKAITALDLRMQKGFNQIELNIRHAMAEIFFDNVLESFDRDIIENIDIFNEELNFMKKITKNTKEDIKGFVKNYCKSPISGPLNLLRKIRYHLKNCFVLKDTQVIDYLMVEWKIVIQKVLGKNVLFHDLNRYKTCTNEIFQRISLMSIKESKKALQKIQESSSKLFTKTHDACNSIISVVKEFPNDFNPDRCILEKLLQAKQYKHKPLHQFSALISSISLNLLINGIFCGNISYDHNSEAYASFNSNLLKEVESISDSLILWIPTNLNRNWPKFEKQIVNEIIQLSPLPIITRKDYNNFNLEIFQNLTNYGNPQYRHQNMISKDFSNFNFFVNCTQNACFQIMNNEKQIRIIVTRHLRAKYQHSFLAAKEWAIKNLAAINLTIQAHRHIPHLSGLNDFFFSENKQHFLDRNIYNTVIIFRDTGNFQCSIKDYAIRSFYDCDKINGVTVINPKTFYDFEGCVQFKVILFI